MKRLLLFFHILVLCHLTAAAQINANRVMLMGRNALYYEDYILAIQRFTSVIVAKP